jgi:hypothetical protein
MDKLLVPLFYARPATDGIEICIQDAAGYRVHFMSYERAFRLAVSILSRVKFRPDRIGIPEFLERGADDEQN